MIYLKIVSFLWLVFQFLISLEFAYLRIKLEKANEEDDTNAEVSLKEVQIMRTKR